MAKFLSAEEVGVYGLFVVLVSYSLYAVGFDFYTFSTRELVLKDKKNGEAFKKSKFLIILLILLYYQLFFSLLVTRFQLSGYFFGFADSFGTFKSGTHAAFDY